VNKNQKIEGLSFLMAAGKRFFSGLYWLLFVLCCVALESCEADFDEFEINFKKIRKMFE